MASRGGESAQHQQPRHRLGPHCLPLQRVDTGILPLNRSEEKGLCDLASEHFSRLTSWKACTRVTRVGVPLPACVRAPTCCCRCPHRGTAVSAAPGVAEWPVSCSAAFAALAGETTGRSLLALSPCRGLTASQASRTDGSRSGSRPAGCS